MTRPHGLSQCRDRSLNEDIDPGTEDCEDEHTLWENNLIWQNGNGYSFMLSWNTALPATNITVRGCTVVHSASQAVFGAQHGGGGALSDYRFEDIVVEGDVTQATGSVLVLPHCPRRPTTTLTKQYYNVLSTKASASTLW